MLDVLDEHGEKAHKDFNIGISEIVPKTLAYQLIKPALVENRNITVSCFEDKTERLLRGLEAGELDLVVTDRPIAKDVRIKDYSHLTNYHIPFKSINRL